MFSQVLKFANAIRYDLKILFQTLSIFPDLSQAFPDQKTCSLNFPDFSESRQPYIHIQESCELETIDIDNNYAFKVQ